MKSAPQVPGSPSPRSSSSDRSPGIAPQAPGRAVVAPSVARALELPAQPYRSLGYFDGADRTLFTVATPT